MKSSRTMYDVVHDTAVLRVPLRLEGKLGYGIDMAEVYRIFFDNGFSGKRNTKDLYIGEWISYGMAQKNETGKVLWIIDPKLRPFLEREKRNHKDCKELEVLS